jgi:hypothetical protein
MSPLRHRWAAVALSLALGATLAGCSGAESSEPTAGSSGRHQSGAPSDGTSSEPSTGTSGESSGEPTDETSSPTTSVTPTGGSSLLRFSPRSGGRHLDDCQTLVPGDDPAEFLYYPVVLTPKTSMTLQEVGTDHTQGVVDAGAWVAPVGPTQETGTLKGWPPSKIVTGDPNLRWRERVRAVDATLAPGTSYNLFLRLQVDPTPGDSKVRGITIQFLDDDDPAALSHRVLWAATTTFSMDC